MMLKIVETMHREAAINIQSNIKRETVLHLAADAGLSSCVKRLIDLGADLSLQDAEGNTVLHRLTIATIKNQRHIKRHLEVFDTILGMVVKWWCKNKDIECKRDNYKDLRKEATLHLIYEIPNNEKLSVIALSFKLGASDIIYRLLMMLDITMLEKPDHIYRFDVSALKPLTNIANSKKSNRKCCGRGANNQVSDLNPQSGLEYLIELKEKTRAAEILDIPSMKRIEEYYNSIAFRTFLLLTILHVVYMSIFTYVGVDLLAKLRDDNRTIDSSYLPVLMLCIVPIEPFLIGLYLTTLLCNLIKDIKSGKKECKCGTLNSWRVIELLLYLLYAAIVIIWIVLFSARCNFQDYVLAAALCIGWLLSIKLTKGFRQIHYFSRMLGSMILNDFVRFAVIYVFVLFAFGSAFHVLFQISWDIVQVYQTPLDTIFLSFNLMTGRGELFDDDFEENMTDAGRDLTYVKIYYLIYVLLSSIILINLLIAMMNDSYKKILTDQQVMWRIESVKLGVGTEAMLCDFLRKKISSVSSVTIVSEGEGNVFHVCIGLKLKWFVTRSVQTVRGLLLKLYFPLSESNKNWLNAYFMRIVFSNVFKHINKICKSVNIATQGSHHGALKNFPFFVAFVPDLFVCIFVHNHLTI